MSIKGEAQHRLHNILMIKLNYSGRFNNQIPCNPAELSQLMGYKSTRQFVAARQDLVKMGLWEYHASSKYTQDGRQRGYFSVPKVFLLNADMTPSKTPTKSSASPSLGADTTPSEYLQSADMAPSETPTKSSASPSLGADTTPSLSAKMAPYNIEYIDSYIDDDETKKVIKKLMDAGLKFKYTGNTARMQAETLSNLIHKVSQSKLDNIVSLMMDTSDPINDAANYLIVCLTNLSNQKKEKDKKKKIKRRHMTDWSSFKPNVMTEKMSDVEMNAIFDKYAKHNNTDTEGDK